MSKIYGYARCSLAEEKGQDLNRQIRELKAAGAEEIITEREHGDAKVKQNLDMLLEIAHPGDAMKSSGSCWIRPTALRWAARNAR